MSKSLSLMVFLKMQKKDPPGNVPLYVRVTVDGAKDDFSLGHKVQPSEWSQEKQLLTGKSQEARLANSKIALMKGTITRIFQSIPSDEKVTSERLINDYFGVCRNNGSDQAVKDRNFPGAVDSLIEKYRGFFNQIETAKAIPDSAIEVLDFLGSQERYRTVKKVVWSTSSRLDERDRCISLGTDFFLRKPGMETEWNEIGLKIATHLKTRTADR